MAFQKATANKVLLRLNTDDAGEGTRFSQQFGVTSLPTFLLLTSDLTIAGVIRGYLPSDPFVQAMNETESKYKDFRKRVSNESAIARDYQKRLDLAIQIGIRPVRAANANEGVHVRGADCYERQLGRAGSGPRNSWNNVTQREAQCTQGRINRRTGQPVGHIDRLDGTLLESKATRDVHKLRDLEAGVLDAGPNQFALEIEVDRRGRGSEIATCGGSERRAEASQRPCRARGRAPS